MADTRDISENINELVLRKEEFEAELDALWAECKYEDFEKFCVYKERAQYFTDLGVITLRNAQGKHTLIIAK